MLSDLFLILSPSDSIKIVLGEAEVCYLTNEVLFASPDSRQRLLETSCCHDDL